DKSVSEAERVLTGTVSTDLRVRNYQRDYLTFKELLLERANKERIQPLELFIIREDPEPSDDDSVQEHFDLLRKAKSLELTILYRDSDPSTWRSFLKLARALSAKCTGDHEKALRSELQSKLAAYFRTKEYEEHFAQRMPMPHPVMLLIDDTVE